MFVSQGAPPWAAQLHVSFASGASGQFVVHGNVNDRMPAGGQLINVEHYLRDELLSDFDVVFTYDLGNGLAVARGGERLADWVPSALRSLPQGPLEALEHRRGQLLRVMSGSYPIARASICIGSTPEKVSAGQ